MGYDPTPDAPPNAAPVAEQIDDELVDLLIAYDEQLFRGTPSDAALETALARLAPDALSCLQLMAQAYPRPSPQDSPPAVRQIGRFNIEQELGRGGFGVVYRARDPDLGRAVAIKVSHAHLVLNRAARERFLREAQTAAKLDHRNIVPVYDRGEDGASLYIVSAYCDGPSLEKWIARNGPVAPRTAAQILLRLAEAIQHSHSRGIVHRDLKPANVLLVPSSEGDDSSPGELPFTPRVTDFGLARSDDANLAITQSGDRVGTPLYMSPEQVRGDQDAIGPAADIYALGAILYEMLTGRPPFRAKTLVEIFDQIRHDRPAAPSKIVASVPVELESIALKCLEKSCEARYPSAAALAQDIRGFLSRSSRLSSTIASELHTSEGSNRALLDSADVSSTQVSSADFSPPAPSPSAVSPRVVPRLLALGAAFAMAVGGYSIYVNTGAGSLRFDSDDPSLVVQLRQGETIVEEVALSRLENSTFPVESGRYEIAVGHNPAGYVITPTSVRIRRNQTEGVTIRKQKSDSESSSSPAPEPILGWSLETPTARSMFRISHHPTEPLLAYGTSQGIVRIVDSRTLNPVAFPQGHRAGVGRVRWSPDGEWLATGGSDKTVRLWTTTGEPGPVYTGEQSISDLSWSGDSSRLVISERASGTLLLWNPQDGMSTRFHAHQAYTGVLAWHPRRPLIAAGGVDDDRHRPIRIFHPDGKLFQELDAAEKNDTLDGAGEMSWSPDGTRLAIGYVNGTVRIWTERDGLGEPTRAFEDATSDIAWTPEGTRLAVSADRGVQFLGADGTLENTIPLDREHAASLAWDAAGQHLYVSGESLHQWTAGGVAGLIAAPEVPQLDCVALSRQGVLAASAGSDVYLWSLRGELRKVISGHHLPISSLAWDTGGRRLATASFDKTVRVWNDDGSSTPFRLHIEAGVNFVGWTPDGSRVVVSAADGPIRFFRLDGAPAGEWKREGGAHRSLIAWRADGQQAAAMGSRPRPGFPGKVDHIVLTYGADDAPGPVFDIKQPFDLNGVIWANDSKRLILWGPYGRVLSWKPDTNAIAILSPKPNAPPEDERHTGSVHSVVFRPDGLGFASSCGNGRVIVWSAEGERQATMHYDIGAGPLAWSADSQRLAVGLNDGTIEICKPGGAKLQTLTGHSNKVQFLAWSTDGSTLYSAEQGHTLRAWDAATGQTRWIAAICSHGRAAVLNEAGRLRYGSLDVMDQDFVVKLRTEKGSRIVSFRSFLSLTSGQPFDGSEAKSAVRPEPEVRPEPHVTSETRPLPAQGEPGLSRRFANLKFLDRFDNAHRSSLNWHFNTPRFNRAVRGGEDPPLPPAADFSEGRLILHDRRFTPATREEFPNGLDVSFRWMWTAGEGTYCDDLTVAVRTTGIPRAKWSHEVEEGIAVRFNPEEGKISVTEQPSGMTYEFARGLSMPRSEWHRLRVTDDGERLAVYFNNPAEPILRILVPYEPKEWRLALYNREPTAGIEHRSLIEEIELRVPAR